MRYKLLKNNVILVFLKDIGKWKKGEKIIADIWVNEYDLNKRCYYIDRYILYDNQLTPLDEFRNNIIDIINEN